MWATYYFLFYYSEAISQNVKKKVPSLPILKSRSWSTSPPFNGIFVGPRPATSKNFMQICSFCIKLLTKVQTNLQMVIFISNLIKRLREGTMVHLCLLNTGVFMFSWRWLHLNEIKVGWQTKQPDKVVTLTIHTLFRWDKNKNSPKRSWFVFPQYSILLFEKKKQKYYWGLTRFSAASPLSLPAVSCCPWVIGFVRVSVNHILSVLSLYPMSSNWSLPVLKAVFSPCLLFSHLFSCSVLFNWPSLTVMTQVF